MADIQINEKLKEKSYKYTSNAWLAKLFTVEGEYFGDAEALSESSATLTKEMVEKKGGPSNLTIFSLPSNADLAVTMTALNFDQKWLALQAGKQWKIGKYLIRGNKESCSVVATADKKEIQLQHAPFGISISIENGDNLITVPITDNTATTIDVTKYVSDQDTCITVVYAAEMDAQSLDIVGDAAPSIIMLILEKKVWDSLSNKHVETLQLEMPRFQLDGNITFAGALGDSDSVSLGGKALAAKSTTCGAVGQTLGSFRVIPVVGGDVYSVSEIAATKAMELVVGEVDNITVMGMKGSNLVYDSFPVTEKCTYTSADETKVTVDNMGKVTGVAVTADTPIKITVAYSGLSVDTEVTVVSAP